jgi:hypothetical protein
MNAMQTGVNREDATTTPAPYTSAHEYINHAYATVSSRLAATLGWFSRNYHGPSSFKLPTSTTC